jgi:hypothetical protein
MPYVVSDHRFSVATKEACFYTSYFIQKSYVEFGLELRTKAKKASSGSGRFNSDKQGSDVLLIAATVDML